MCAVLGQPRSLPRLSAGETRSKGGAGRGEGALSGAVKGALPGKATMILPLFKARCAKPINYTILEHR